MTDEEEEDEPFAPILCVANRIKLIRLLSEVEPRFLKKVGFASDLDGQLKDLEARLRRHIPSRSDDSLEEAADAVSNVLDELQRSSSNAMLSSLCAATVPRYKRAVEDLAQAIEKVKPTSDEHEDDWKDDEEVFTDLTIDKVLADI